MSYSLNIDKNVVFPDGTEFEKVTFIISYINKAEKMLFYQKRMSFGTNALKDSFDTSGHREFLDIITEWKPILDELIIAYPEFQTDYSVLYAKLIDIQSKLT